MAGEVEPTMADPNNRPSPAGGGDREIADAQFLHCDFATIGEDARAPAIAGQDIQGAGGRRTGQAVGVGDGPVDGPARIGAAVGRVATGGREAVDDGIEHGCVVGGARATAQVQLVAGLAAGDTELGGVGQRVPVMYPGEPAIVTVALVIFALSRSVTVNVGSSVTVVGEDCSPW